ncbi:MAG: hypothetical protein U0744_03140 [Gemmataceae bacterium]
MARHRPFKKDDATKSWEYPSQSRVPYPTPFLRRLRETAEAMGLVIRKWKGDSLEVGRPGEEPMTMFLGNLHARVKNAENDEHEREIITGFFNTLAQRDEIPDDLDECRKQIMPRVGKPFQLNDPDAAPWHQKLGDTGLVLNLVVDFPDKMAYVRSETLEKTNRPIDEWIELGLVNLEKRTPEEWHRCIHEESGICIATCEDAFDAARCLILERLLPGEKHGFLTAVVGRDCMFFMPVRMDKLGQIHLLKVVAEKNIGTTPYPISDKVYWVHDEQWLELPIELQEDGNVVVRPPQQFVEALELADGPPEEDEAD